MCFCARHDDVTFMVFCAVGKAVEQNKQRQAKLPQPPAGISEPSDSSTSSSGLIRTSHLSDGSDASTPSLPSTTTPTHSSPTTQVSDTSGQESDSSKIFQFLLIITSRGENIYFYSPNKMIPKSFSWECILLSPTLCYTRDEPRCYLLVYKYSHSSSE